MTNTLPTVSCLLPTTDRFELFTRSVACYCRQTYSRTELVVVSNGEPEYRRRVEAHLRQLGRSDIRQVFVEGDDWTLGRLRNLTLESASGELVCQWDDDDLYHPLRIERQVTELLGQHAMSCFLSEMLQYFVDRNELYWTIWDIEPTWPIREQVIPGTLLCWRSVAARYPESGPHSDRLEDMDFLDQLVTEGPVARISGEAYLYVYVFHGRNVWPFDHHWNIAHSWRKARSKSALRWARRDLERHLALFEWPQLELSVCGGDGRAFRSRPGAGQSSLSGWLLATLRPVRDLLGRP